MEKEARLTEEEIQKLRLSLYENCRICLSEEELQHIYSRSYKDFFYALDNFDLLSESRQYSIIRQLMLEFPFSTAEGSYGLRLVDLIVELSVSRDPITHKETFRIFEKTVPFDWYWHIVKELGEKRSGCQTLKKVEEAEKVEKLNWWRKIWKKLK